MDELEQQQQGMRQRLKASVHLLQQRNRHCQALQAIIEEEGARLANLQAEEKSLQSQCGDTAGRRVMSSISVAPEKTGCLLLTMQEAPARTLAVSQLKSMAVKIRCDSVVIHECSSCFA